MSSLEEYGRIIHDRRGTVEEFWGEPVKHKSPPKGMEGFSDSVSYVKDGEQILVWYRMGRVAAVLVPTLNDDTTIMRAAHAIVGDTDFVEDKFCMSKIYGAYNKYRDECNDYAVLVKRSPKQWLIAGDAEFIKDFDSKPADAIHKAKYGK